MFAAIREFATTAPPEFERLSPYDRSREDNAGEAHEFWLKIPLHDI